MATTASTSRLGLCSGCPNLARYTCPACSYASCSLPCLNAHKLSLPCTGLATPIWSKPLAANEWGWGTMMRDQSYISSVGRRAEETGRELVGMGLIPKVANRVTGEGVLDERTEKELKFVREARGSGVKVVLLPKGMNRRIRNASRWNPKESRMEWSTEFTFYPHPSLVPSTSVEAPLTLILSPTNSSSTLHQLLTTALDLRDKKGKGKALSEVDEKWIKAERDWLSEMMPDGVIADAVGEGSLFKEEAEELVKTEIESSGDAKVVPDQIPTDQQPFLLLLFSPPIPDFSAPPPTDDSVSAAPSHISPVIPQPLKKVRAPPRTFYLISPITTLSTALEGTTILEFPTFEFISRESYLRSLAKGEIEIVAPAIAFAPLPSSTHEKRGGSWERGSSTRGGRGRGGLTRGGSSRGRGGREGGGGSSGRRDEINEMDRTQDSGWGKRALPATEETSGQDEEIMESTPKKVKVEVMDVEMVENGGSVQGFVEIELVVEGGMGGGGLGSSLVDYGSD